MTDIVVTERVVKEVKTVQPGTLATTGFALIEVENVSSVGSNMPAVQIRIDSYWFQPEDLRQAAALFNKIADALNDKDNAK